MYGHYGGYSRQSQSDPYFGPPPTSYPRRTRDRDGDSNYFERRPGRRALPTRRRSRRSPSLASSENSPSPPPAPTYRYEEGRSAVEEESPLIPVYRREREEIIIRRDDRVVDIVDNTEVPGTARVQYGAIIYETFGGSGMPELNAPRHIVRDAPIKTVDAFADVARVDSGLSQPETSEEPKHEQSKPAAFVITRYLGERGRKYARRREQRRRYGSDSGSGSSSDDEISIECDAGVVIKINSQHIIDTIEKVAKSYPGVHRDGNSLLVPEPFCVLVHFRDEIMAQDPEKKSPLPNGEGGGDGEGGRNEPAQHDDADPSAKSKDGSNTQLTDIQLLYEYIDGSCLFPMTEEKQRWQEQSACTFDWLWLLFAPGTMVYETKSANQTLMRAYRVVSFRLDGLFQYESGKPIVEPQRLKPAESSKQATPIERIAISVEALRHDGRYWHSSKNWIEIPPFRGQRSIRDLPIYPTSYHDALVAGTEQRLVERGRQYHSLAIRGQVEYHGDILSGVRRRLDGRIVVDSETFHYEPFLVTGKESRSSEKKQPDSDLFLKKSSFKLKADETSTINGYTPFHDDSDNGSETGAATPPAASQRIKLPIENSLERFLPNSASHNGSSSLPGAFATSLDLRDTSAATESGELPELTDQEYMICAPDIQAYALKERAWVVVAVENISDCVYEENMIDNLQISPEANRLVQALSHTRKLSTKKTIAANANTARKPWTSDFISNKGGGQIILLHGRPGVGKTTTAECIAEMTNRPLLTITCGDLGIDAISVEGELGRWLRIGTLWNAVLLFDEADVFLESRAHGDIDRNSLVSVFLRALEYYQGLMFLTTNRIGSFDEAIISRIHVVLHLPNLTNTDRARIWDSSFRKLAKERKDIHVDYTLMNYAHHDTAVHELQWNGREIRNAFNTMIALAEWDAQKDDRYTEDGKVEVRREHLEEVVKMSGTFKGYLRSLRQMEHEQYMKSLGLRDDKYRAPERR